MWLDLCRYLNQKDEDKNVLAIKNFEQADIKCIYLKWDMYVYFNINTYLHKLFAMCPSFNYYDLTLNFKNRRFCSYKFDCLKVYVSSAGQCYCTKYSKTVGWSTPKRVS